MKHSFSEYDPPKNTGLSWDASDSANHVPEMGEFKSELQGFYNEVFQPVWQFMSDTISTLLMEWFSGGMNTLGQLGNWFKTQQQEKAARAHQAKQNPTFKQAKSLTLETKLAIHKINNDLGKQGSSTLNKTDEKTNQSVVVTNPWLEAVKKQSCTLPMYQPKAQKPNRPKTRSKKTIIDEPNRGLDDIYTSPVSALFTEEQDLSTLKKTSTQWKKPAAPVINTQIIAAMIDAELDRKPQPRQQRGNTNPILSETKQATTQWSKPAPKASPNYQSDAIGTYNETFEYLQTALYSGLSAQFGAKFSEPKESEFIPGLTLIEEEIREAPIDEYMPRTPDSVEIQMSKNPQPSEAPLKHSTNNLLMAKAKAADNDFKQQMPVYHEMKNEMSGAEHMVRNNRILHNSISNLADSYFKKAAQEAAEEAGNS